MEDAKTKRDVSAKKPYSQPSLQVYGDIQTLTRAGVGMGAKFDTRGDFSFDTRTH